MSRRSSPNGYKWTKNQNVDGVVVMRRAVNMRLRNAVHHAGNTASRDPRFAPMYARLRASGANHARAVRGVADRLLGVLIGMLRTQTLYQSPVTAATVASSGPVQLPKRPLMAFRPVQRTVRPNKSKLECCEATLEKAPCSSYPPNPHTGSASAARSS